MPYNSSRDRSPKGQAATPYQARRAYVPTLDDVNDLPVYAKALYIGTAGDVTVVPVDNRDQDPVTFPNHPVGYMPVEVRRILATGTTAAGIRVLHD